MRSDMEKVIVERPRQKDWKGDNGDKNPFRFNRNSGFDVEDDLDMDYYNSKESLRKTHKLAGSYKTLNENLSPLYNFIRKNVGRKYDDVYSEIRKNINANNPTQLHILEHVKQYVCQDQQAIYEALNEIYIWRWGANNHDFYVDEKGILCRFPKRKKYVKPPLSEKIVYGSITIRSERFKSDYWNDKIAQANRNVKGKKFPKYMKYNDVWFAVDWHYSYPFDYSIVGSLSRDVWSEPIKHDKMREAFRQELIVGRSSHTSVSSLFPTSASPVFRSLTRKELKELKKQLGE